jgi:hypothetical protein
MAEFMVVLRGGDPELKKLSRDEARKIMERYYSWVERLKVENRYRGGSPLKEGSKLLSGRRDFVVIMDGPYQEHSEALTGYFVIEAAGLGEAVEIAKTCPALSHGESVEVLQLDNH